MSDRTGTRQRWFRIENAVAGDRAVVRIFDMIGGWFGVWASELVQELDSITSPVIELHVNSPGGDAFEGIAIMNALRQHPARVEAFVDGMAASAASYIVVGGADEVVMSLGAELMVHNPKMGTYGDAAFHRSSADQLDKLAGDMAGIYARKAGGTRKEWLAAMASETWYTAEEAVAAGLADRIDVGEDASTAAAAAASTGIERRIFAYAGRSQAPAPRSPAATSVSGPITEQTQEVRVSHLSDEQIVTLRQRLGVTDETATGDQILAALDEALTEQAGSTTRPVPEGMALVDAAALDELRTHAAAGQQARAEQLRERRERLVNEAVSDGRIPPARRAHWIAQLEADPGAETVLASMAKGLVPLAPVGSESAPEDSELDALYASLFGSKKGA